MRQRAVIRTPYPSLQEIAEHYDVSVRELREQVRRFMPILEGTASKPLPPAEPARSRARRKMRIRLHVAARRRGTKSKK